MNVYCLYKNIFLILLPFCIKDTYTGCVFEYCYRIQKKTYIKNSTHMAIKWGWGTECT